MSLACVLCVLTVDLSRALLARAQAQTAADAAALAAAQEIAIPTGAQPVDIARSFAERNHASLGSCACDPGASEAVVEVTVSFPLVLLGSGRRVTVSARAVIGPLDTGSGRDPSSSIGTVAWTRRREQRPPPSHAA
jgi:secretion/DNA translocation related TadE-like protein